MARVSSNVYSCTEMLRNASIKVSIVTFKSPLCVLSTSRCLSNISIGCSLESKFEKVVCARRKIMHAFCQVVATEFSSPCHQWHHVWPDLGKVASVLLEAKFSRITKEQAQRTNKLLRILEMFLGQFDLHNGQLERPKSPTVAILAMAHRCRVRHWTQSSWRR